MNKSEKIMAERMTFTTKRGRTAEYQKAEWLRNLRAERNKQSGNHYVIYHLFGWYEFTGTLRQAKIAAKMAELETARYMGAVSLVDANTQIELWNNYKV